MVRRPEIVIGLVGAVGTPLDQVSDQLAEKLAVMRYGTSLVRVSELIQNLDGLAELGPLPEGVSETARLDWLMSAGTHVRERLGLGEAMAGLAVGAVRAQRAQMAPGGDGASGDHAYVIRSLKRPEEIEALRRVYADQFVLLGVWTSRESRVEQVARRIAATDDSINTQLARPNAERLVAKDESEPNTRLGQDVRNTFPLADYFVDGTRTSELGPQLDRFVRLLFGHLYTTPSRDEMAMFHAYAAALRSSALGRQVGAAITDSKHGDLLSTGTNEVPRAHGGHYWEGDEDDARDFVRAQDASDQHKRSVVRQVITALRDAGWLKNERSEGTVDTLITEAMEGSGPIAGTRLASLIEFGRDVHAEMSAIVSAARRGIRIEGADLFCTTFPCHNCAKHIIAAGITRVVYIEPYAKSLASELHDDAIALDARDNGDPSRIAFVPFVGVAPRRYATWFTMRRRKDNTGKILPFRQSEAEPWFLDGDPGYLEREKSLLDTIGHRLEELGIGARHGAEP